RIHAPLDEGVDLGAENVTRLGGGDPAKRRHGLPERPDGPGDPDRPADDVPGLFGDLRAVPVHVPDPAAQVVGVQLHRVGAEGVGLDHLGAGAEVVEVDVQHALAVNEIEGV